MVFLPITKGVFTAEMGYVVMVAFMMLGRTWCDVWMLKNGTAIEGRIIARDYKGFLVVFLHFVLASFPIAGDTSSNYFTNHKSHSSLFLRNQQSPQVWP